MRKPFLFWFHSHFLLSTGGTRFVFEVIQQLQQKYQIVIVVEKSSPEWVDKYQSVGVRIHQISPVTSTSVLYWLLFPLLFIWNYWQICRIVPKDAVIISSMFPFQLLAGMRSRRVLYYCFEPFAFFYDRDLIRSFSVFKQLLLYLLGLLYSPLDKLGVRLSKKVITINPSVGKYVQYVYNRSPDDVTYLGVDTNFFQPKVEPLFPKKAGELRLFHSTDFTTLKGTWFLLNAVSKLPKHLSWKLFISESLANNTEKAKYLEYISHHNLQNKITFLGHVPYPQLPQVYASCDIYCFTGSPDSQGATMASLSVLEASSSQLAVIRSIGNTDEVIDGKTGVLVDPRDTHALVNKITELIKHPQQIKSMGLAGRRYILSKYRWELVGERIRSHIEKQMND